MKEKVLILIPTNHIKAYCIGKFIKSLKALDLENTDILFSDDGKDDEHKRLIERLGYEVIKVDKTVEAMKTGPVPIVQCLANTREALRKEFIKRKDYTHALWLDSDIIPPKTVVKDLLKHEKDLVSGIYFQSTGIPVNGVVVDFLMPVHFRMLEREAVELGITEYGSKIDVQELFPPRLIGDKDDLPLVGIGMGCVMFSRKLMEDDRWNFRFNPEKPDTTEDLWFSVDIVPLGYTIYADTGVLCYHHFKKWEGARNR